jgi:hypothetical protein
MHPRIKLESGLNLEENSDGAVPCRQIPHDIDSVM